MSTGDKLLLYTDGIPEAQNQNREFFGLERLTASFITHRDLEPEALVRSVLADVRDFCDGAPLRDDVAIVVMQMCESDTASGGISEAD